MLKSNLLNMNKTDILH